MSCPWAARPARHAVPEPPRRRLADSPRTQVSRDPAGLHRARYAEGHIHAAPHPAHRDRIRDDFQSARVEWPEHDAGLLDRLAARIQSGNLEVVLFNRYGGHIMDDKLMPVLRDDLSRWVRIEHGYGVEGVRQAMAAQWAHIAAPEDVARDAP